MAKQKQEKIYGHECEKCGQFWATTRALKVHLHHCQIRLSTSTTCDHCEYDFQTFSRLRDHQKNLTGKRRVKCKICDKTLSAKKSLVEHMKRVHPNNRPLPASNPDWLPCETCGKRFGTKKNLNYHIRHRHVLKKVKCKICLREMGLKALNKHIRSKHPADYIRNKRKTNAAKEKFKKDHGEFKCVMCEKQFKAQCYLFRHLQTHTGEKPFFCNFCSNEYGKEKNLGTHLWRKHGSKGRKLCKKLKLKKCIQPSKRHLHYSCGLCRKQMNNPTLMLRHVIRIHGGNESAGKKCLEIQKEKRVAASINRGKEPVPVMKPLGGKKREPVPRPSHGCYVCGEKFFDESLTLQHIEWCQEDNGILVIKK